MRSAVAAQKSILRKDGHGRRLKGHGVVWRTNLVGDNTLRDLDAIQARAEAERRMRARLLANYQAARLPQLTYEMLVIPMRVAFPELTLRSAAFILLDVFVDVFELSTLTAVMRRKRALAGRIVPEDEDVADEEGEKPKAVVTWPRILAEFISIICLHAGRALFITTGRSELWYVVQVLRFIRVRDLLEYMQQIGEDLGTNPTFLAVFKFSLVMFAVPHWMACSWQARRCRARPISLCGLLRLHAAHALPTHPRTTCAQVVG